MSETELFLIDHGEQVRVNREPDECAERLGIKIDGHGPAILLDIGSGIFAKFARAFVRANPDSSAIVVDPHFSSARKRKDELSIPVARAMEEEYGPAPIAIGGHAEKLLSIRDNSVDLVTALWSVPHYLPVGINAQLVFSEIIRVLKSGGKAILYPIESDDYETYKEAFEWISAQKSVVIKTEPYIGKSLSRLIINKL